MGGALGVGINIVLTFLVIILTSESLGNLIILGLGFPWIFLSMFIYPEAFFGGYSISWFFIGASAFSVLINGFIIGALIGLIVYKFKKKKTENQNSVPKETP